MKVVILCGGLGTRITEESHLKPKPMIEIGDYPILWHIMKGYAHYGYNEFIICAGYKQHIIKDWFASYSLHNSDVTFDFTAGADEKIIVHSDVTEPMKVTVVDTGVSTMTGGRIKRVRRYIGDEPFFLTYGDGVSNVDIEKELDFHRRHGKMVTMTGVRPEGRFGILDLDGTRVQSFREKKKSDTGWINGGFMIVEPKVIDYITSDKTVFERRPLEQIADEGELMCYKHNGFWQCMDTMKDKMYLDELWASGEAPWKIW